MSEVSLFLVSLIPLTFIPVSSRKSMMKYCAKGLKSEFITWSGRFILLLVGFVFIDTLRRLHSLDSALHDRHEHHGHNHAESPLEDLQYKTKLFYSQRNMYLSAMSLFMVVVLYRRMKDIYQILQLQEAEETGKVTIKALKDQINILISQSTKEPASKEQPKKEAEKVSSDSKAEEKEAATVDPTETGGIRKRK
ncbi:hypothetical protein HDV05_006224 [Chytridiales sp. JEL 0842]|nr:hypothetical protein HDV05_006224 [Chytridiales sp. JEL 0842]